MLALFYFFVCLSMIVLSNEIDIIDQLKRSQIIQSNMELNSGNLIENPVEWKETENLNGMNIMPILKVAQTR